MMDYLCRFCGSLFELEGYSFTALRCPECLEWQLKPVLSLDNTYVADLNTGVASI